MKKITKFKNYQTIIESCGGGHSGCGGYSSAGDSHPEPSLSLEDKRRIRDAARRRSKKSTCNSCDELLVSNAKFCHNCGKEVI